MSRCGRKQCESNIYHVTARGVNGQVIFESDCDRMKFADLLREHLDVFAVELLAWCFMQNHVHLLLRCPLEVLSCFMGHVLSEYAKYFNWKHGRDGQLYQGRFFSKAVESDAQLLATVRYIHQNPMALGVADLASYRWSSYVEYVDRPFIVNTDLILEMCGDTHVFAMMHKKLEADPSLEPGPRPRYVFTSDDEAIARAKQVTGVSELTAIASFEKEKRDACLAMLRNDGFTIATIERLTGIGRNIIQRAR